jgi:hypothetical protein
VSTGFAWFTARSSVALRGPANCEIFNNSEWHAPFFEFSKYLVHLQRASKLAGPPLLIRNCLHHRWLTAKHVKQANFSTGLAQLSKYSTHVPHIQFVQARICRSLHLVPLHVSLLVVTTNHQLAEGATPGEGNTSTPLVSNVGTQHKTLLSAEGIHLHPTPTAPDCTSRQQQEAIPNHLICFVTMISFPKQTTQKMRIFVTAHPESWNSPITHRTSE